MMELLAGDLYLPEGVGPFPAIVTVHGGGCGGARITYQYWGPHLSVAVLSYSTSITACRSPG
jgi:hypothetical protein